MIKARTVEEETYEELLELSPEKIGGSVEPKKRKSYSSIKMIPLLDREECLELIEATYRVDPVSITESINHHDTYSKEEAQRLIGGN